jgi:hypothetical protein
MPTRGEHDDFETAKAVVQAGLAALAGGDWEMVRSLSREDSEHVTREGVFRGPERMISEFAPQLDRWTISFDLEELIDAGGGALVLLLEVERRNPRTGKVGWKAWPAVVVRIHGSKVAYMEGYIDRRKALEDLGLPPAVKAAQKQVEGPGLSAAQHPSDGGSAGLRSRAAATLPG